MTKIDKWGPRTMEALAAAIAKDPDVVMEIRVVEYLGLLTSLDRLAAQVVKLKEAKS